MLSAITHNFSQPPPQLPPVAAQVDIRAADPRAITRSNDPRQARTDPRSQGQSSLPPNKGDGSNNNPFIPPPPNPAEPVIILSSGTEDTFGYNLHSVTLGVDHRNLPPHVTWSDPRYQYDPRVQKQTKNSPQMPQRQNSCDQKTRIIPVSRVEEKADPRSRGNDPRSSVNDPRSSGNDPRSSVNDPRSIGNDPRNIKPADPLQNVGRLDDPRCSPCGPSRGPDPRMQRTLSAPQGAHSPTQNRQPMPNQNSPLPNKQFSLPPLPGIPLAGSKQVIDIPKPPMMDIFHVKSPSIPPSMPAALQHEPPRIEPARPADPRLAKPGKRSPGHSDSDSKQPLSHRNDPRFKKKTKSHPSADAKSDGDSSPGHGSNTRMEPADNKGSDSKNDNKMDKNGPNDNDAKYKDSQDRESVFDPRRKRRRNDLEYNSPLGGSSKKLDGSEDAYNSYNRPRKQTMHDINNGGDRSHYTDRNRDRGNYNDRGKGRGQYTKRGNNRNRGNIGHENISSNGNADSPDSMPHLSMPPPPGSFGMTLQPEDMQAPPILEAAAPTLQDDRSLKDMFKGIDPTASPFC